MNDLQYRLITPASEHQNDQYYTLRWQLLRAPWNQPVGSERDEYEANSQHLLALNQDVDAIGVGRIHFLDHASTAQIRYMAVSEQYRGKQIGTHILLRLEEIAREHNIHHILLEARENALNFYTKHDYQVTKKSHILFGCIQHYRMEKSLF